MDKELQTEFLVLTYTYEDQAGESADVEVLYNPELDQFFLGVGEEEFLVRRYIKQEDLRYTRHNGMIYAPLAFFRRIAALLPENEPDRDTGWIDQIEENGRSHLIATEFQGGAIDASIN